MFADLALEGLVAWTVAVVRYHNSSNRCLQGGKEDMSRLLQKRHGHEEIAHHGTGNGLTGLQQLSPIPRYVILILKY